MRSLASKTPILPILLLLVGGAAPRSWAQQVPAPTEAGEAIEVAEPCRYIGTIHRKARAKLEVYRACGVVDHEGFVCLARALAAIDASLTASCPETPSTYEDVAREQQERFRACIPDLSAEAQACALSTGPPMCTREVCAAARSGS